MLSRQTKLKIALIITLCIAVCILVLGIITNIGWLIGRSSAIFDELQFDDAEGTTMTAFAQEPLSSFDFNAEDVNAISVDWAAGAFDIHVLDANDDDGMIHITEYARGSARQSPMEARCDAGVLSIDYNPSISLFNGCVFGKKVAIVELPISVAENLELFELDGASGQYDLSGLQCESMRLHLASGKLECTQTGAKSLKLELTSGSMNMTASVAKQLDINITSGSIDLVCEGDPVQASNLTMTSGQAKISWLGGAPERSSIKVTSGNLMLAIPDDAGFEAYVKRTTGNFSCNLPCEIAGDAYLVGDRSSKLDISLTSGNIELRGL